MILLADWASFRKSGARTRPEEEEANPHEDEGSIADVVISLIDNVQMASRHGQATNSRFDMQAKLDGLSAKVTELLQSDLEALRLIMDRQLKVLFSPLLNERLEAKAVEDFCNGLISAVGRDTARHLVISAPPELQDRLAARLAQTELNTSINPSDGQEISTSLEATEITTEIGRWKADLQRLLS